jgi:hypothetical protein
MFAHALLQAAGVLAIDARRSPSHLLLTPKARREVSHRQSAHSSGAAWTVGRGLHILEFLPEGTRRRPVTLT